MRSKNGLPLRSSPYLDQAVASSTPHRDQIVFPSTSQVNQTLASTSKRVSPFDIAPVPTLNKNKSNRGRKSAKASLVTGTPYREELQRSLDRSKLTKRRLPFTKSKKKINRPPSPSSSDSEDHRQPPLDDSESEYEGPQATKKPSTR